MAAGGGVVASGFFLAGGDGEDSLQRNVYWLRSGELNFSIPLSCGPDREYIILKPLQKSHVSDRIDEICKSKEKVTQANVMIRYGEGRAIVLSCRNLIVGSGNDREATGPTIILIQGGCNAQRI